MLKLPHCKVPCKDCPFRKDTLKGWLGEERMTTILQSETFVCHKDFSLQCAGHMIINEDDNVFVRTAKSMGIELQLSGQELIFKSKKKCINHHKF